MSISVLSDARMNNGWYTASEYNGREITLYPPTGTLAGDQLAVVLKLVASSLPVTPAGWTLRETNTTYNTAIYTKTAEAGETSWTWSMALASSKYISRGVILAGRGAASVSLSGTWQQSNSSISFPAIVLPQAGCHVAEVAFAPRTNSHVPNNGFAELLDLSQDGYTATFAASLLFAAAGSTGAFTVTVTPTDAVVSFGTAIYFQPAPAPTVTAVAPGAGGLTGGTPVAITGTGFTADCTVDIGGAAATSVVVVSATQITCVTPARTAGAKTVTVTNSGGDGALASGFTYTTVLDANVKLIRGGAYVGNDKADAVTEWPGSLSVVEYGGSSDLWGTTFTPAQVNASDFGVGIAATVGSAAMAKISHVEMEVAYSIPGIADPQTYLAVLKVDAERASAYPAIYRLPRSGYTIANDPSLDRRTSNASLFTSRIYEPARYIEKTYRAVEFWADVDPEASNTVGLQVWCRVDDGNEFQLLGPTGAALTVRSTGRYTVWFPSSDVARGKYFQLEWRIPEAVGDQVAVAIAIRNVVVRFNYRPETSETHTMPLLLGTLPTKQEGLQTERRSPYQKLLKLFALAGPGQPPVPMRDELGRNIYVHITAVSYEEVTFKPGEDPSLMAFVSYRVVEYS